MDQKIILEKPQPSKKVRTLAIIYNSLGCILTFIAIVIHIESFNRNSCLIYPLLGILIMAFSKGSIKFLSNISRGQNPGIFFGFLFPALALFLISMANYDLLRYADLLLPGIATIITFFLILCFTGINYKADKPFLQAIIMIISAGLYCIAALIIINCEFDDSPALKFNTTVESKFIERSKSKKHYTLVLTPWERKQQAKQIEVTQSEYEQTPVDGPVGGHIKRGYLHIRWFYLDM